MLMSFFSALFKLIMPGFTKYKISWHRFLSDKPFRSIRIISVSFKVFILYFKSSTDVQNEMSLSFKYIESCLNISNALTL